MERKSMSVYTDRTTGIFNDVRKHGIIMNGLGSHKIGYYARNHADIPEAQQRVVRSIMLQNGGIRYRRSEYLTVSRIREWLRNFEQSLAIKTAIPAQILN